MDAKLAAAIIAAISLIVIAFINYKLNRRSDKKSKKTEMRTQAYADYVAAISELAQQHHKCNPDLSESRAKLASAKTCIAIFGHRSVVEAIAKFDENFSVLNSEDALDSFVDIVSAMRQRSISVEENEVSKENLKIVLFGNGS